MTAVNVVFTFCALIAFSTGTIPSQSDYEALGERLECGFVVTPNNVDFSKYASSNVPTWDTTKIPSAVVMCSCEQDVVITMSWLTDYSIPFTIRSGGHSMGGFSKATGAVLIDLSEMNGISILSDNKVSIESGVDQNEYEQWKFNNPYFTYTVPHGVSPFPSFGGISMGGGIGLTTRQWGVTSDYIDGVRVVLCDGTLWEIWENDDKNTKCIQGCDDSSDSSDSSDDSALQDLLYAIKGSGGGNFGVITRYYFNTHADPENPMYFFNIWPVINRDTIYNALKAFQYIQMKDYPDNNDFALLLIITPPSPPFGAIILFQCIYLSPTADPTIFYEIMNKITGYLGMEPIQSMALTPQILAGLTLTQIYTFGLFPTLSNDVNYNGYYSSRLVFEDTFNDPHDTYFNAAADRLWGRASTLAQQYGIVQGFAIETLGGNINIKNKETSFPKQNRKALASIESFFAVSPGAPTALYELAKSERNEWDENILDLVGDKLYINYLDDFRNDPKYYYSNKEIKELQEIKEDIDQLSCFNLFEIERERKDSSDSSDSESSDESAVIITTISSSTIYVFGSIICLLLFVSLLCLCYSRCCSSSTSKTKYDFVSEIASSDDDMQHLQN